MPLSGKHLSEKERATEQVRKSLHQVLRTLVFRMPAPPEIQELPVSQLKCLFIVGDNEGLRLHDLADRMEIKLPATSQIVERLVKRGHLERVPDPEDRRAVKIFLTENARHNHYAGIARHVIGMETACDHLDIEQLKVIAGGLTTLADAATRAENELNAVAAEYHPTYAEAEIVLAERGITPKPFSPGRDNYSS